LTPNEVFVLFYRAFKSMPINTISPEQKLRCSIRFQWQKRIRMFETILNMKCTRKNLSKMYYWQQTQFNISNSTSILHRKSCLSISQAFHKSIYN